MFDKVIYTVGGTVQASGGTYISRGVDEELLRLCRAGEFCYVFTARQMGKSSLMVATIERLAAEGIRSVEIDLTKMGTELSGLTAEQWYLGLIDLIVDQLDLDVDYMAWWDERARLGPTQRLSQFLRQIVLEQVSEPVVIFIDEIDSTLNLDFTDDFFAAIRFCYNTRADDPEFKRLTFVLLGVAIPADLIKDRTRTPFNIGRGITLQEFSQTEAAVLQAGLEAVHHGQGEAIFARIYHWANGHPYLIQKLCLSAVEAGDGGWNDERVDKLVEKLFLSEEGRKEINLQFVRDGVQTSPNRRRLLTIYRRVHKGEEVPDEERSLAKNRLKLLGLVKSEGGILRVRNEIYRQVFNLDWIKENTPVDWIRRIAIALTAIALLLVGVFGYLTFSRPQQPTEARAQTFIDTFQETTSADVRITSLAGLFQLPGYEDRARKLFHEELSLEERRALFEKADPQGVGAQLVTVVKELYTELENNDRDNQLLEAMAQPLRELDDPMAVNLATEIGQWLTGRKAYAAGEYQQAVDAYSAAISLNDRHPGTHFDRAIAYAGLGQYEEALADLQEVLQLDEKRALSVDKEIRSNGALYDALTANRAQYPKLAVLVPTPTPTCTFTPTPLPTPTLPPSQTPVPPTVTLAHTPRLTATPPPTVTATHTPRPPMPTPVPTVVPQPVGPIALTIYLRDTLTETGFAVLSSDRPNGGMIYEEGKFVYGEAAVQIGETIYHFDKPEVEPGDPEQLPDPWRVEFEFAEELVARTGNQAGFDRQKAQFWVGTLDYDSAVGEDNPYSLMMKLYEGDELRGSIQVFFTVADAPGPGPGPEGTPDKPPPP